MEYTATLICVKDMEAAKKFYVELLEQSITMDLGANVALGKGIALQTMDTWGELIGQETVAQFGWSSGELVFETEDLDAFMERLAAWPQIKLMHPVRLYPWGQRVVRLYDPDGHLVEVGESMKVVVKRFLAQGMSMEEVEKATMFPRAFIEMCVNEMAAEG